MTTTTTSLLLDTARRGELHHAIILHGPSPALLRDTAVRVAKTLNCLQGSTSDDCASCLRIDRRTHPDVHFVEAAAEKKLISIEQIRDIVSEATLRPYEGRNKVFLIDPADGLSVSGSNSLLKTLEEPARDTTFLLLTRSPDLLLPTIKSRCQHIYVGDTAAKLLTGPREATRIRQVALLEDGEDLAATIIDLLHRYATRGESAALLALAAVISDHDDVKDAIALLGSILCDVVALDPAESLDPKKLAEIRERIPRERLLAAADTSMAAIRWLAVNADVRLLAESVVAALVA
ncbi:MAG TPA: DNA polymerase III subunit [Thermoanaerobaculia bacterium]|jgi:DNA polymerase-3 subunit delta'|nr:DNA polymerase III subunit [Thermoanaerobaculia bacterium]